MKAKKHYKQLPDHVIKTIFECIITNEDDAVITLVQAYCKNRFDDGVSDYKAGKIAEIIYNNYN